MILTDEQQLLREAAHEFAEQELRSRDADIMETGKLPGELFSRAAEIGLTGLCIPEEFGGTGMGAVESAIVLEEVAKVTPGFAQVLQQSLVSSLLLLKTPELAAELLPRVADGSLQMALAIEEPTAMPGQREYRPLFSHDGDDYVLDGERANVVNVDADLLVVYGIDAQGASLIAAVDAGAAGVSARADANPLGLAGNRGGTVTLRQVRVPATRVAAVDAKDVLNDYAACLATAIQAVGCTEGFFAKTMEFCTNRTHAGEKLTEQTAVRTRIADLQSKIVLCRTMAFSCARLQDEYAATDDPAIFEEWALVAESTKACVGELLFDVQYECMKLNGGMSYHEPIYWRFMADGVGYCIDGGTREHHLAAIAELIGLSSE